MRPLIDVAELIVTGQVLGFDGQFIRIATDLGELTVDYTKVSCDGTACPDSRPTGAWNYGCGRTKATPWPEN